MAMTPYCCHWQVFIKNAWLFFFHCIVTLYGKIYIFTIWIRWPRLSTRTPAGGEEIYIFCRSFLGYHNYNYMYIYTCRDSLSDPCPGVEYQIFQKETMSFHFELYDLYEDYFSSIFLFCFNRIPSSNLKNILRSINSKILSFIF